MESAPSDEDLLEAWLMGDARAFEAFFVKHQGRVAAYAYRKGISRDDVPEVVQEVFLKLHKHISTYEVGKKAMPWFFTLVHHTCIDQHRKVGKTKAHMTRIHALDLEGIAANEQEIDAAPDLSEALATLSPEQRSVLDMRLYEELSFKEISTRTGKTEVSLRKLHSRAVALLRDWFEGSKGGKS